MADPTKIVHDGAVVKLADVGSSTLTDLGYVSEDAVRLKVDEEIKEVKSSSVTGKVTEFMTKKNVKVSLGLLEMTLANIARALNVPDSSITGNTLTFKAEQRPEEKLVLITTNPAGFARTFTFDRGRIRSAVDLGLTVENEQILNLEFEAFPNATTNVYGTMIDATS